ncbi:MAG: sulfite exporter TauE/SafE family protein [Frankia sp.]|nr:sulfite exporter TauE/SafE family protein [Frankia sp.]
MDGLDALLTAGAGVLAGAVNAVAGGGTLIAFPALLAAGLPAVTANITSSAGLVTGYAGGAYGYRRELAGQAGRLRDLGPAAALGGLAGAVVLLITPADGFDVAVPFLVLLSCLLLAVQSRLAAVVARRRARLAAQVRTAASTLPTSPVPAGAAAVPADTPPAAAAGADPEPAAGGAPPDVVPPTTWPTRIGVFVAGMYGSYFGAGLGVLLLGVLGILLVDDLQRTNALKTLLSFLVNLVGVVVFLASAEIAWAYAGILVVASALGGVLGARVARRLRASHLRAGVITLGLTVAIVLLVR